MGRKRIWEGKGRKSIGEAREREGEERVMEGKGGGKESRNTASINSCLRP